MTEKELYDFLRVFPDQRLERLSDLSFKRLFKYTINEQHRELVSMINLIANRNLIKL